MIPLGISYNDNYLISTDFDRSFNVYVIDLVRENKIGIKYKLWHK
jgi:hypothetical protein